MWTAKLTIVSQVPRIISWHEVAYCIREVEKVRRWALISAAALSYVLSRSKSGTIDTNHVTCYELPYRTQATATGVKYCTRTSYCTSYSHRYVGFRRTKRSLLTTVCPGRCSSDVSKCDGVGGEVRHCFFATAILVKPLYSVRQPHL